MSTGSQQAQRPTLLGKLWVSTVSLLDVCMCAQGLTNADRSVVVPLDEAEQTGLRPEQVQISQEYGGGFPANVEGLHHLHCLVRTLSI